MMLGHSEPYGASRHNQNNFHLTIYASGKARRGSNLPGSIRDKALVKVKELTV
jgi:hypothetical protein